MGAEFDYFTTTAKTEAALKKQFKSYCEEAAYENGHSYSGCLNMCSGLEIHNKVFETEDEAYEYVDSTAQKWENAIAVRFKCAEGLKYFVGGVCSS